MAFTNYAERVANGLRAIFAAEYGRKPELCWGEGKGSAERFELALIRTDPAEPQASRRGRVYVFRLDHVTKFQYRGEKMMTVRAEQAERIEELLDANRSYANSTGYVWHNLLIGPNDLEAETDEDQEAGSQRSSLEFSVYVDKLR